MDFTISAADMAFREEVRSFIEAELPTDIARRGQHIIIVPAMTCGAGCRF